MTVESGIAELTIPHRRIVEAVKAVELGINLFNPPVYGGIHVVTSKEGTASFSSTDMDICVTVKLEDAQVSSTGSIILDGKELKKSLSAVVAGETKKTADATPVTIKGDVIATQEIEFPVKSYDVDKPVQMLRSIPPQVHVDGQQFMRHISRIVQSACTDDTLPVLCCAQVTITPDSVTLEATDRYRFARAEMVASPAGEAFEAAQGLLTASHLKEMHKQLGRYEGPVTVALDGEFATFGVGPVDVTLRVYEVGRKLPAYGTLSKGSFLPPVEVDRDAMVRALKKVSAVIRAKSDESNLSPARVVIGTEGLIVEPCLESGRVRGITVPAKIPAELAKGVRRVAFNPGFMLDGVQSFEGASFMIHLKEDGEDGKPLKPFILNAEESVSEGDFRYLLMPIRLQS